MLDLILVLSLLLVAVTIGFAIEYYRNLVKVKNEYEKTNAAFNDIILSFSRELKRTASFLEAISCKVEAASANSKDVIIKVDELEGRLKSLESKAVEVLKERDQLLARIAEFEKETRDVVTSHKELASKISLLEEKARKTEASSEQGIEAAIPIKKEKALANLTDTELAVLEMLAAEGPKTAPEIKHRIKLSREHTARLMKKLYEEGYLERDSSKVPFKYSTKKEMQNILKKAEQEAT
ncbi:MAG: helix-turn-helix domain-containing protein [Candidatus Bathyarchaeia archaeon]